MVVLNYSFMFQKYHPLCSLVLLLPKCVFAQVRSSWAVQGYGFFMANNYFCRPTAYSRVLCVSHFTLPLFK
jgi:hypothetical protein